ncbi:MAG: DUF4296 domain-containing protein [Bacteroidota bacterium]
MNKISKIIYLLRSRFLALAVLSVFIFSCSKPKPEIPKGILTQKEMVPVLVDIHVAQAATGLFNTGDTSKYTMNDYIPYILSIHHIEKAVYDSSVAFYTQHPEIMQEMYDDVIDELSKKQGEVSSK